MSESINLDKASKHVKNIVDSLRCIICDNASGSRISYPCGDSACLECAANSKYCLLCLTPPDESTEPILNRVLSTRVKHASDLLNTFQDLFHVDVVKRPRISGQLKVEKELFPDCIQALQTYQNKRKSDKYPKIKLKTNKNQSIFPGEIIEMSDNLKIKKSRNYVQEWLDEHETELFECKPRKPFSDLEVNTPKLIKSKVKKRADIIIDQIKKTNENQSIINTSRKRSHFKTTVSTNKSHTGLGDVDTKKRKIEWKCNLDDEPIVIEDSQSQVQDKDTLAWLAVLKAHDNNTNLTESTYEKIQDRTKLIDDIENHKHECSRLENKTEINDYKVPFYKKSKLAVPFNNVNNKKHETLNYKGKDVSIIIETKSLIANIKVNRTGYENLNKQSKYVQTDFFEEKSSTVDFKKNQTKSLKPDVATELKSQDLFTGEPVVVDKVETKINENSLVIDSSDSEHEQSSILIVEADVHERKPDDIGRGILTEIRTSNIKTERAVKRGCSPQSSNSSDKENRDPNSMKQRRIDKKIRKKNILRARN